MRNEILIEKKRDKLSLKNKVFFSNERRKFCSHAINDVTRFEFSFLSLDLV